MLAMLGAATVQALVELDEVPKIGEQIVLRQEQIKWASTTFGWGLYTLTPVITSRGEDAYVNGQKVPWFNFRTL